MKRNYYIFTPGKLSRKDNTIFFVPFTDPDPQDDENLQNEILLSVDSDSPEIDPENKKVMPVSDIDSFYLMAEATFNTKFTEFCSKHNIPIHLFNRYGYYSGSFYPREHLNSGFLTVNQTKHYLRKEKRLALAKNFVDGAAFNLIRNLKYYNNRGCDLDAQIDTMDSILPEIDAAGDIQHLMNAEGRIRKIYYTAFEFILLEEFKFGKRSHRPPSNPINALISFCNALVYTSCLSEIYMTQLNPTVSFLHEPGQRRFSLALDISEIFKPILSDRIIFKLVNNKIIKIDDFEPKLNGTYLKEKGRKKVIQEFDQKLKTTIKHRQIKRDVSYKRLIRLECYKIIKHLTGDKNYEPFKIWW